MRLSLDTMTEAALIRAGWTPPTKTFLVESELRKYTDEKDLQFLALLLPGTECIVHPSGRANRRKHTNGYDQIAVGGTRILTHRAAYILHVGPIPPGYTIDHTCCNKRCVNWAHMEAVTRKENQRRAIERKRHGVAKGEEARRVAAEGQKAAGPRPTVRGDAAGGRDRAAGGPVHGRDGGPAGSDGREPQRQHRTDRDQTEGVLGRGHGRDRDLDPSQAVGGCDYGV